MPNEFYPYPKFPLGYSDLTERLRTEEYLMGPEWGQCNCIFLFKQGSRYLWRAYSLETEQSGHTPRFFSWLDIKTWPPREYPGSRYVHQFVCAPEHELWALLAEETDPEDTPDEDPPDNAKQANTVLYLSRTPVDEQSWQAVPFPDGSEPPWGSLSFRMFFIDDDLFYEWDRTAWVLPKAASLQPGEIPSHLWRKLLTVEVPEGWYSYQCSPHPVTTGGGTRYIAAGDALYSWSEGECRRLYCAIHRMPSESAIPSGKHTFMYVDSYARIVECDVRSGNKRFRSFPGAHGRALRDIGGGWAAFFSTVGWDGDNPTVIFWNRETDEWLPLCRGALGREGLLHIEPHTEGDVLVFTYNRLYRVFDLIGQIKALRSISVGEWSDDPEETSPRWFIPALEAELELTDIHDIRSTGYDEVTFSAREGVFMIEKTAGLWNKLHTQRKKECPTHQQIFCSDGSSVSSVYNVNKKRLYRSYPHTEKAPAPVKSQAKPKAQTKPKTQVAPQESPPKQSKAVRIIANILFAGALAVAFAYALVKFSIVRPLVVIARKLTQYFRL